jgi:hypothetical protein
MQGIVPLAYHGLGDLDCETHSHRCGALISAEASRHKVTLAMDGPAPAVESDVARRARLDLAR